MKEKRASKKKQKKIEKGKERETKNMKNEKRQEREMLKNQLQREIFKKTKYNTFFLLKETTKRS